jgi:thioredoxin reductase (NADPH)
VVVGAGPTGLAIKSGEIRAYFHSRVVEIRQDSIRVATPAGEVSLKNDFVFALI